MSRSAPLFWGSPGVACLLGVTARTRGPTPKGVNVDAGEVRLSEVLSDFARTMVTGSPIQRILDHLVLRIVDLLPIEAAGVESQHLAGSTFTVTLPLIRT